MTDALLYTRLRTLLEALEVADIGAPPTPTLVVDIDSGIRGMGDVAILLHELDLRVRHPRPEATETDRLDMSHGQIRRAWQEKRGDPCDVCLGTGLRTYANTSTWRRGAGGASMTTDVCSSCWGSGSIVAWLPFPARTV